MLQEHAQKFDDKWDAPKKGPQDSTARFHSKMEESVAACQQKATEELSNYVERFKAHGWNLQMSGRQL